MGQASAPAPPPPEPAPVAAVDMGQLLFKLAELDMMARDIDRDVDRSQRDLLEALTAFADRDDRQIAEVQDVQKVTQKRGVYVVHLQEQLLVQAQMAAVRWLASAERRRALTDGMADFLTRYPMASSETTARTMDQMVEVQRDVKEAFREVERGLDRMTRAFRVEPEEGAEPPSAMVTLEMRKQYEALRTEVRALRAAASRLPHARSGGAAPAACHSVTTAAAGGHTRAAIRAQDAGQEGDDTCACLMMTRCAPCTLIYFMTCSVAELNVIVWNPFSHVCPPVQYGRVYSSR